MPHVTIGLLAALAVALLAAGWSSSAQSAESLVTAAVHASDPATNDSGIQTVSYSYSTGEAGHKLRWVRSQTSRGIPEADGHHPAANETGERFAQYTSPVEARPADRGAVDPFDDPFEDAPLEDAQGGSPSLSPATTLHDGVLEGAGPQPLIAGPLPRMIAEDQAVDSESSGPPGELPEFVLEDSLAVGPGVAEDPCAAVEFRPIREITHDISAKDGEFPSECPLVEGPLPERLTRGWAPTTFTWKATGLCHKPAYFEDVHLERYGHSWGPCLQPVISGAHFFLTVPVLPYKMGLYPPNECVYTLGYYRPGSCAPYMLDPLPLSIRAGLAEAGVWTGMVFLIP